jgi:hypothetical protein
MAPVVVPNDATLLPTSPALSSAAVDLAAEYNPVQPWIEAVQTAWAGAEHLGDSYFETPAVLLQQFLANQVEHLGQVLQNPGSIGAVLGQVLHNVQSAFVSSTLLGLPPNSLLPQASLDGWHDILRQSIPKILVEGTPPVAKEIVQQLLNVLSSPLSGVAMGFAGPFISPVVALLSSIHEAGTALFAGDFTTAMQNIIDIPANMVGAVLNGANLNLDGLVPVLNKMGLLTGTTLHNLNIQFGGLFSTGVTGVAEDGIGGSIFNAIGLNTSTDMMGFPLDLEIAGRAIGPIAALVSLGQILAKAIGWDGTGNPLAPVSEPATAAAAAAPQPESKTTTSTNESPSALPSTATPVTIVAVSEDTVTEVSTSGSESSADDVADDAPVDDADVAESGSTDGTDEAESGSTGGTDEADPGSTGDTDDPKSESTSKRRSGNAAAAAVSSERSPADDGGSDSGASDSQE